MSTISNVLNKHSKKMMKDVQGVWKKYKDDAVVSGKADIEFSITDDKEGFVSGTYTASGQKMWILEYGKGNLLDKNNPYLSDYTSNKTYNRNRDHFEVRTRDTYNDLDGNTHRGIGRNLNTNAFAYNSDGKYFGKRLEFAPLHVLKEHLHREGTQRENEFREDLLSAVGKNISSQIRLVVTREGGVFK